MLFSIVIPVYNVENYLKECLDSIYKQNFSDYEVIIVDDGSSDNSPAICDEYKEKHPSNTKVIHKINEGLLKARCDGFKETSGEYILCCDSDDYFSENAFEILHNVIELFHPDIIQYDLYLQYENGKCENVNRGRILIENRVFSEDIDLLRNTLLDRSYIIWSMCGKCIKSECIDRHNGYKDLEHIKYGEDTLESIDVYNRAKNFVYIDDVIYYYRAYTGMTNRLPQKYIEDFFEITTVLDRFALTWNLYNYEYLKAFFIFDIVHFYMLNISDLILPIKECIGRLKYVYSRVEYKKAYEVITNNNNCSPKMSLKRKIMQTLIAKRMFFLLAVALKARGLMKCFIARRNR